jgi:peptidyl-prolyl cis-trans isomerase SurA
MRIYLISLFALAFILTSCTPKQSDIIVASFDNHQIKMKEFEDAYVKNVGSVEQAKKDSLSQLKNFLDLYVKFKMKLRDAEIKGYDQDTVLKNELTDYQRKIGSSYILEKKIVEPWVDTLYNRRKWEYRVSHIMVTTQQGKRSDSAAYQLAQSVLDSIKQGASFEDMAKKYSDDRFSKDKGGDIFYITAGQVPWQFEDAVYATPVGKVYPEVVKTRFGYHIIKVTEKRARVPKIRASHILAAYTNKKGVSDTAAAKAKIDSVMEQLKNGADFAELAKKYSDDTGTKEKGGDLGFFERRQMVPAFDEAAFNLKKVGDISGIIQSPFGYHIIKLTGKQEYPSLVQDKDDLKKILQKTRYNDLLDSLDAKYEKEYNYHLFDQNLDKIVKATDSLRVGGTSEKLDEIKELPVYSYASDTVTAGKLLDRMSSTSDYSNRFYSKVLFDKAIQKFSNDDLLAAASMDLPKTDKDFADLMEDYKNGIYIFKLQDDEVWSKLNPDSTQLYQYYEQNKDKYKWPDRVDAAEIYVKSDSLAKHLYSLLEKGNNFDTLASKYTERMGYKMHAGHYGLIPVNSNFVAQAADSLTSGEFTEPLKNEGGYSIVKLIKKDPAHVKSFEEAKAEVSSAYQEVESKNLEQNYIESLDKIYKPELNYDALKEAFKGE